MKICGLAKLTLLDFPGKLGATLFTGGCNMRCPFCHNGGLVTMKEEEIPLSEIFAFLEKRMGVLEGIAITGGEPLMNPDIEDFIIDTRSLGFKIKLDTNGSYPERLKSLTDKGLIDYIAMDIKNSWEKYPETVGLPSFDVTPVKESSRHIMACGVDYEFRTTALKPFHGEADFMSIANALSGARRYFIQRFRCEGAILGNMTNPTQNTVEMSAIAEDELNSIISAVSPFFGEVGIR